MTAAARKRIGFDRKIEIAWLDAVAAQAAAGASQCDAREYVWRLLAGVLSGDTIHDARGKTLTVLANIWLSVPPEAREVRNRALPLLRANSGSDRLPLHWAMIMASYPFFLDIAVSVGKLVAMNGDVTLSQIIRRMLDSWGDRSTLPRATQRVLRSMVQWGALRDGEARGQYLPPLTKTAVRDGTAELLIMGLLTGLGRGLPISQLLSHPALFPFAVSMHSEQLGRSSSLQFYRQGDHTDYVEVKH